MTAQALKARPTSYNEIGMRPRLEARVAAWLDSMDVAWEYEPRAFASGASQYLPDFLIQVKVPFRYGAASDLTSAYIELKPAADGGVDQHFDRMAVIRASEPSALTVVWYAHLLEEIGIFNVEIDAQQHRYGAFVLCGHCGWTFLAFMLEGKRVMAQDGRLESALFLGYCPLCEAETLADLRSVRTMPEYGA